MLMQETETKKIPYEIKVEQMGANELQKALTTLVTTRLKNQETRNQALEILDEVQQRSLHLEEPESQRREPINVSLLPIVIPKEVEDGLTVYTEATNLVRAAVLLKMEENEPLRKFLEHGVDPLAVEIMRKNPFMPEKAQWRWRSDTSTHQIEGRTMHVENNGGEPQGDGIISDSQEVVARTMEIILEGKTPSFYAKPDEQMMKVMQARYRIATGEKGKPTIGYMAFRGRSSLSQAEANYTARKYKENGGESVAFDPRDIVDIVKRQGPNGNEYCVLYVEQEGNIHKIELVRRLHGEPMENTDLWEEFKAYSQNKLCSDREETIWERFTGKMSSQMINPLNSWATDKKLDVVMGNPQFLKHFGVWEKVKEILENPELAYKMSLSSRVRSEGVKGLKEVLKKTVPEAYMLRRQKDGLYPDDKDCRGLCLSEEQIEAIKNDRYSWVIKRDSLGGHSGTAVHVGRAINLAELGYNDYLKLTGEQLETITGMTRKEFKDAWENNVIQQDSIVGRRHKKTNGGSLQFAIRETITQLSKKLSSEELGDLRDNAWKIVVENSLDRPDCLVQKAIDQSKVPVLLFPLPTGNPEVDEKRQVEYSVMNWDLDPQSISIGRQTHPVIRISSKAKTNITGGYGGLGVAVSENQARKILKQAHRNENNVL